MKFYVIILTAFLMLSTGAQAWNGGWFNGNSTEMDGNEPVEDDMDDPDKIQTIKEVDPVEPFGSTGDSGDDRSEQPSAGSNSVEYDPRGYPVQDPRSRDHQMSGGYPQDPQYNVPQVEQSCPESQYMCRKVTPDQPHTRCIPNQWKCNGIRDCEENDDEIGCDGSQQPDWQQPPGPGQQEMHHQQQHQQPQQQQQCGPYQYQCYATGIHDVPAKCMERAQLCDQRNDCPYNDDERDCAEGVPGASYGLAGGHPAGVDQHHQQQQQQHQQQHSYDPYDPYRRPPEPGQQQMHGQDQQPPAPGQREMHHGSSDDRDPYRQQRPGYAPSGPSTSPNPGYAPSGPSTSPNPGYAPSGPSTSPNTVYDPRQQEQQCNGGRSEQYIKRLESLDRCYRTCMRHQF